jgi:hypothetical protein
MQYRAATNILPHISKILPSPPAQRSPKSFCGKEGKGTSPCLPLEPYRSSAVCVTTDSCPKSSRNIAGMRMIWWRILPTPYLRCGGWRIFGGRGCGAGKACWHTCHRGLRRRIFGINLYIRYCIGEQGNTFYKYAMGWESSNFRASCGLGSDWKAPLLTNSKQLR